MHPAITTTNTTNTYARIAEAYPENKEAHTAILWIGNDRTGSWLKLHAMAPPEAILDAVRKLL